MSMLSYTWTTSSSIPTTLNLIGNMSGKYYGDYGNIGFSLMPKNASGAWTQWSILATSCLLRVLRCLLKRLRQSLTGLLLERSRISNLFLGLQISTDVLFIITAKLFYR